MKISAVIPVYNRAHCVVNAIKSVLNQTQSVHEIIVVDDGSTDNLKQVIDALKISTIQLIQHEKNKGASAARNTGIQEAKYEYIAFLDSDDIWLPHKIARQMHFMEKYQLEMSCTNFSFTEVDSQEQREAYRPFKSNTLTVHDFAWGCFVSPGSTFVCHINCLKDVGGYNTSYTRFEDWDLLLNLTYHHQYTVGWCSECLSVIYVGEHAAYRSILESVKRIQTTYGCIADYCITSRLRSAVFFYRSHAYFLQKRYVVFLCALCISWLVYPVNNTLFKWIFFPKLKRLLRRKVK